MKRIISVVSNDISTDNRVHKIALSLMTCGFAITIAGRKLKNSDDLSDRPYNTRRFKLIFNKGPLFYANLNLRLFFYLSGAKVDIILSNDLDTLLACCLAALIKRKKLVYDSHELFPEVPELVNRRFIRSIWLYLERKLIRKPDLRITVSPSIAKYYKDLYNIEFIVIRNAGKYKSAEITSDTEEPNKHTIIYQGALNIGRGIELAIQSMQYLENISLIIAGTGDIDEKLKKLVAELSLDSKVVFTGRLAFDKMGEFTKSASIGLSLEEDLGLNYRFALPNKLFDYIQARIPVIVSDLPEMRSIVEKYQIGEILEIRTPENLAATIRFMLEEHKIQDNYSRGLNQAATELNWEEEEKKLIDVFKTLREE